MSQAHAENRELTYSGALNEALREEMRRDSRVFVMGQEITAWGDGGGVFGVTRHLLDEFGPHRVRDTPISEQGIVAMGVGAAVAGLRPVVELMYFDFVTLAMDPLVNQAAKLRYMFGGQASVPIVLRSNVGASGGKAAQHSQSLESWLVHVPGLKVVVPSTPADARGLLKTAIRDDDPVVFLEHKLLYFKTGNVRVDEPPIPFGQASVRRAGTDVTVIATHAMLGVAEQAAELTAGDAIELEIIDPRTLVPLDVDTIVDSVRKTNRLVICHEAVERGGWAGEVAMRVMEEAFDYLDAPIVRVCGENVPMPYSAPLEERVVPSARRLADSARELCGHVVARTVDVDEVSRESSAPTSGADVSRADVLLPRVSDTMESGLVLRWFVVPGDAVRAGDKLLELETDKVTVIIEAEASGVLEDVFVAAGTNAPVGSVLASIRPSAG